MNWDQHYVVDWDKVANVEDVKAIVNYLSLKEELEKASG